MTQSFNCIVCAGEFNAEELCSEGASKVNSTNFKVCQKCLDQCDPSEDYRQAREIVETYLKLSEARHLFGEVKEIIDTHKIKD